MSCKFISVDTKAHHQTPSNRQTKFHTKIAMTFLNGGFPYTQIKASPWQNHVPAFPVMCVDDYSIYSYNVPPPSPILNTQSEGTLVHHSSNRLLVEYG
jgi:hypothetical protein